MSSAPAFPPPSSLVAELTHRCPLGCPYCSNPPALVRQEDELDSVTWARVFAEAAALGVGEVHLSGGEPGARRDLVEIAASAREAGLGTNLVTSGVGIATRTMRDLWEAGLDRVTVSFQDADAVVADRIADKRGAFQRKYALAVEAVRLGLPLAVNVVVHRANIDRIGAMVALALELRASRIEIVQVQDHGWARKNRAALTPTLAQVEQAEKLVEELRRHHRGGLVIEAIAMDDCAGLSSACNSGRGRGSLHITPSGRALPCPGAEEIPSLEFWNVRERPLGEIWLRSPAFLAFRDFSGCPCRADRLTGDERASDPGCAPSPLHALVKASAEGQGAAPYVHRRA